VVIELVCHRNPRDSKGDVIKEDAISHNDEICQPCSEHANDVISRCALVQSTHAARILRCHDMSDETPPYLQNCRAPQAVCKHPGFGGDILMLLIISELNTCSSRCAGWYLLQPSKRPKYEKRQLPVTCL